ncbi:MAG: hypothetical protein HY791_34540 [Deltaproteobacteria bacterium]|nr:hypothetical protein [Deltaproteobacteria bacterium]
MKVGVRLAIAMFVPWIAAEARAACPASTSCAYQPAMGTNPDPPDFVELLEAATRDGLPGAVDLPAIEAGPSRTLTRAPIACATTRAIAAVESSMLQFCDSTGITVISFDCGYGVMQVTTGASRYGEELASSVEVNVGAGTEILVGKWNAEYGGSIGESDPSIIESWYYSFWAYNGFVYSNHPENPSLPPNRPPYNGPGALPRGDYPYQELVLGMIRNPYDGLWDPIEVTYPAPGSIDADPQSLPAIEPEHVSLCPPACPDCDGGVLDDAAAPDATPVMDAAPDRDAAEQGDAAVVVDASALSDGAVVDAGAVGAETGADASDVDAQSQDVLKFRPGHEELEGLLPAGSIGGAACRCRRTGSRWDPLVGGLFLFSLARTARRRPCRRLRTS